MIKVIITLVLLIALLLLTSWLFELQFIADHWTRQAVIYLMMLLQLAIGLAIIRGLVKNW